MPVADSCRSDKFGDNSKYIVLMEFMFYFLIPENLNLKEGLIVINFRLLLTLNYFVHLNKNDFVLFWETNQGKREENNIPFYTLMPTIIKQVLMFVLMCLYLS